MSFLLDQNISYRVVFPLSPIFSNVKHVKQLGLADALFGYMGQYAKSNGFTIITFDSDFIDFSILKGSPPKTIWLRFGNSSNLKIVNKLISNEGIINEFILNDMIAFLEID